MRAANRTLRCRESAFGYDPVFLTLAIQPSRRRASANRIDHGALCCGAVDCRARCLRSLGGMAQLDSWTVAEHDMSRCDLNRLNALQCRQRARYGFDGNAEIIANDK